MDGETPNVVHYLPIATTVVAAAFAWVVVRRYVIRRSGPHLLWWGAGVVFYGLGTALESSITLFGNNIELTKAWYIAGALLGGYPLAQGTVYLLLRRKTAHLLSAITVPFIAIVAVFVIASPVDVNALQAHRPGGDILEWQWVRTMTPLINGYAALFLIGGAVLSAHRAASGGNGTHRAIGNALIAVGALLPGIGGGMAKAGIVEALYVGEFVGLLLIWAGFFACTQQPRVAQHPQSEPAMEAA